MAQTTGEADLADAPAHLAGGARGRAQTPAGAGRHPGRRVADRRQEVAARPDPRRPAASTPTCGATDADDRRVPLVGVTSERG
jgi:hypothetical protein